jgi:hypothetical protein
LKKLGSFNHILQRLPEITRKLKKLLLFLYIAEIPAIPFFTYLVAKEWKLTPPEEVYATLLTLTYGLFHVWAITEYKDM